MTFGMGIWILYSLLLAIIDWRPADSFTKKSSVILIFKGFASNS